MSDSLSTAEKEKKKGVDLRRQLHSAFAFVRSVETNKSLANIELEHLIKEHIENIKSVEAEGGKARTITDYKNQSYGDRLTKIDRLLALQEQMKNVVSTLNSLKDNPDALKAMGLYETEYVVPDEYSSSADQSMGFDAYMEATVEE